MQNKKKTEPFPAALEDARAAELSIPSPQTLSPSYRLADNDTSFPKFAFRTSFTRQD